MGAVSPSRRDSVSAGRRQQFADRDDPKVAEVTGTAQEPRNAATDAGTAYGVTARGSFGRDRLLVVVCVLLGAGVGAYRLWTVAPQFAATARLYVEPTETISAADPASSASAKGKVEEPALPPTDVLLGAGLAQTAIQIGNLKSLPCYANEPDLALDIISNLEVKTAASQSGVGQIQDLKFTGPDRKAAQHVLESIITAYEETAEQWRLRRITELLASLEKQRMLLTDRLQKKQQDLEEFKGSNPSAFRMGELQILDGRLKALVEARIRAELRRIEAEVRLRVLEAMAGTTTQPAAAGEGNSGAGDLADVLAFDRLMGRASWGTEEPGHFGSARPNWPAGPSAASPAAGLKPPTSVGADEMDLEAERRQVAQLAESWGPDHPKLQAAKARLAELERNARRQAERSIRAAQAYFQYCRDEEDRLQRTIEIQRASASDDVGSESAIRAQILQQVVERTGKILTAVCERIDRLSLESAAAGIGSFRITTLVPPNTAPVVTANQGPKLFLVPTGIGLLVGFALSYLSGSKKAAAPSPVRPMRTEYRPVTPREFILGYVPAMPRDGGRGSERTMGTWVLRESGSKASKAFRRLAKRVVQASGRMDARCVLVSSTEPREGKSVVLANLATAIAQSGRSVLLIDANYDHPSQHVLLSDVLSLGGGPAEPVEVSEEAFESGRIVMRTQLETLSLVPAWPKPERPSEILKSSAMREFIRQGRAKYDLILIDGPAVSDRESIDRLAESADAVAYVSDAANMTTGKEKEIARQVDLPALGLVVNTIPPVPAAASSSRKRKAAAPAEDLSGMWPESEPRRPAGSGEGTKETP